MMSDIIYHGDCLEIMPTLQDGSIDMVLCDPPYGTTACKWDYVIPFDPMWDELKRLIKPNGAIVMTACQPFTSALVMSNAGWFKYDWTWQKTQVTGYLNAKKQPMRNKEDILVFYNKQCLYNPQMTKGKPFKGTRGANAKDIYRKHDSFVNENFGTRYPKQVIKIPQVHGKAIHPTQKPVALMEYLIKTYTNPGETILDFAAGSGTTGVACQNLDRRYVLIEKEEKYVQVIRQRIEEDMEG
jgi:site-specific DNA-methyltransferase (adenine-specific)